MFAGAARRRPSWCVQVRGFDAPRRRALAVMLLGACLAGAPSAAVAGEKESGPSAPSDQVSPAPVPGIEVPGTRDQHSVTFEQSDGKQVTRLYGGSISYQDAQGQWQPIDNRLSESNGVIRNGANRYSAELPTDLSKGAVKVQAGRDWVSFAPQSDALRVPAAVAGETASYDGVWPGVSVSYATSGDAVSEQLAVKDLESVQDFAFTVRAADGLRPVQQPTGAIEFRAADGATRLTLPASLMFDAKGRRHSVTTRLSETPSGWTLTVSPDRKWLSDENRAWPVTIDPQVSVDATLDCTVGEDDTEANYEPPDGSVGWSPAW